MISGVMVKKIGMTRIFSEKGSSIPVTILKFQGCTLLQHMEDSKVQVSYGVRKKKNVSKSIKAKFSSIGIESVGFIKEFSVLSAESLAENYKVGDSIPMSDIIAVGDKVSAISRTKGKGFQGVVKRHGFGGGRKTHGSRFHRAPGSIGACATPSRVFKGTKLPGRMGFNQNMIKNLTVVGMEDDLIYVSGSVSGSNDSVVYIKKVV